MKDNEWKEAIHILRRQAGFDFAGIASVVRTNRTLLVWRAASGNRNRNYLKIVLEPGKGIAGGVFQHKKTMIVQDVKACYTESEIVHSPILLAEDLGSFTDSMMMRWKTALRLRNIVNCQSTSWWTYLCGRRSGRRGTASQETSMTA